MRRIVTLVAVALLCLSASAQKKIFIPEDLRGIDLQADTSRWSFARSIQTDDLIFMWERGFDRQPSNGIVSGPDLDGHPMRFSLTNLRDRVQSFSKYVVKPVLVYTKGGKEYKAVITLNMQF